MKKKLAVFILFGILCVGGAVFLLNRKDEPTEAERLMDEIMAIDLPTVSDEVKNNLNIGEDAVFITNTDKFSLPSGESNSSSEDSANETSKSSNNFEEKLDYYLAQKAEEATWTDAYKEYNALSEDEKKDEDYVPNQYKGSAADLERIEEYRASRAGSVTLPSKYSLAETYEEFYENDKDNQQWTGLCWAFAGVNAMEGFNLTHGGTPTKFSEAHMDVLASDQFYFPGRTELTGGGGFGYVKQYLLMSNPAIATANEWGPYYPTYVQNNNPNTTDGSEYDYLDEEKHPLYDLHITKIADYPAELGYSNPDRREELKNEIKTHILVNGALSMGTPRAYRCMRGNTIYCNTDDGDFSGHAMTFIGWDDDYAKTNFVDPGNRRNPENNGAWLVKNSWCEANGSGCYYWMSYEDYYAYENVHGFSSNDINDGIVLSDFKGTYLKKLIRQELGPYIKKSGDKEYVPEFALDFLSFADTTTQELVIDGKVLSTDDVSDMLKISDNFKKITLKNLESVSPSLWTLLRGKNKIVLQNVGEISDGEDVTLSPFSIIASNENLSELEISNSRITATNVNQIANLSNLVKLTLENTQLSSVSFVNDLNELQFLNLSGNNTSDLNLSQMRGLLDLRLNNASVNSLADLHLNSRVLLRLDLDGNSLDSISGLPSSLRDIHLSSNNFTSYPANLHVDTVYLSGNLLSNTDGISSATKELHLENNKVALSSANSRHLKHLYLKNSRISSLNVLDNHSYNVIDLSDNNITSLSELGDKVEDGFRIIDDLYLSGNHISSGLNGIQALSSLGGLYMDNCDVTSIEMFNTMEISDTLSLNKNKNLEGKYTGEAKNLFLTGANLDKIKLRTHESLSLVKVGNINKAQASEILSSGSLNQDASAILVDKYLWSTANDLVAKYDSLTGNIIGASQLTVGDNYHGDYTVVRIGVDRNAKRYAPTVGTDEQKTLYNFVSSPWRVKTMGKDYWFTAKSIDSSKSLVGQQVFMGNNTIWEFVEQ